jgi:hypothetical protein
MSSKSIKILQISNLLVTGAEGEAAAVLDELAGHLSVHPGKIDYIVVCGNITASRSQKEFEAASHLLRRLAHSVLVGDPGEKEVRLDRMVVIPGRSDVDEEAENPLAEFGEFYARLYRSESDVSHGVGAESRVPIFDPDGVLYKDLKDLTIIGVPYWSSPLTRNRQRLVKLAEALKRKVTQDRPRYCHYTPTVVCSTDSPFDEQIPRKDLQEVRHLFTEAGVGLQLLGATGRVVLVPQPDRLDPLGVTTGRCPPEFWPFRGNLLELRAGPPTDDGGEPHLSLSRLVKDSLTSDLTSIEHIKDGRLNPWIELMHPESETGNAIAPYLKQIEKELDQSRFVIVSGPAGSGKSDLYGYISHEKRLAERSFDVACVTIDSYQRTRLATQLKKAAKELKAGRIGHRLLLVQDRFYHRLQASDRSDLFPGVRQDCYAFLDGTADFVIYFVARAARGDLAQDEIAIAELKPIDREELAPLVRDYCWRIPIADQDLYSMTGGYVGLSRLFLDEVTRHFDGYAGAEPVGLSTGSALVCQAIRKQGAARSEVEYLRDDLRRQIGDHIFFFLQERVALANGWEDADAITFAEDELVKKVGSDEFMTRIGDLTDSGVTIFNHGFYTIRAKAPFLVALAHYCSDADISGFSPAPVDDKPDNEEAEAILNTDETEGILDNKEAPVKPLKGDRDLLAGALARIDWKDEARRRRVWQRVFPDGDLDEDAPNTAQEESRFEEVLLRRVDRDGTPACWSRLIRALCDEEPSLHKVLDPLLIKFEGDSGTKK